MTRKKASRAPKKEHALVRFDNYWYLKIFNHHWPKPVIAFSKFATRMGDGYGWVLYGALFFILAHFGNRFTYATSTYFFVRGIVGALFSGVVFWFIKTAVNRKRPYVRHKKIVPHMKAPDKYSFPSGHTIIAFSMILTAGIAAPLMLTIALVLAFSIAISRVIVGVHYPLDVIAGMLIGIFVGLCTNWLFYFLIGPKPLL